MHSRVQGRLTVAAALGLFAFLAVVLWPESHAISQQAEPPFIGDLVQEMPGGYASPGKIAPTLTDALALDSPVSVIVTLAIEPGQSQIDSPLQLPDLVAAIDASASGVISSVAESEFVLGHQYQAVPALVGDATEDGVAALAALPNVAHVALNAEVHADLAEAVPLIGADDVHNLLGVTGEGVVVAVLDTGIDTDHPLLAGDINHQHCFQTFASCPGGGSTSLSAEDGNGHGTHVSGIITSTGPPGGVAPDALIDAFKVLNDSGSGSFADVLAAYDEIILNHPEVDIINMSLGDGFGYPLGFCETVVPALTTAVATTRSLGMTSFSSAGNNGSKFGVSYPACLNDVISVGAVYDADVGSQTWVPVCQDVTTAPDQVVCFSQSGLTLDLLAPGATIDSTALGGGLVNFSGTSMASPVAAAVAALLLESEPLLVPVDVETRLSETGVPITDAENGVTACRVDAYEALINDGGPACATSSPPVPPCPAEGNDGFEDGLVHTNAVPCWTVVDQSGSFGSWCLQLGTKPPQGTCFGSTEHVPAPRTGNQAVMTNRISPGSSVLYRCLTLAEDFLSFDLYIANLNTTFYSPLTLDLFDGPNQQFRADLVTPAGIGTDPFTLAPADILVNLYQTQPGDSPVSGYSTVTVDVSAYVGQPVCLRFAEVDNQSWLLVGIDDVRFSETPPPDPTPTTPTPAPTPEMLLNISQGDCDDPERPTKCDVVLGSNFTLSVDAVVVPPVGYVLMQTFIHFGSDLIYNEQPTVYDEISWPDCSAFAVRAQFPTDEYTLQGCLTGAAQPLAVSHYVGNVIALSFSCSSSPSSTEVRLVPQGEPVALTSGTQFADPSGNLIIPSVGSLTVNCVPPPTPTPTFTPTPTATPLPIPRMSKSPALRNVFLTRQGAKIPPVACLSGNDAATLSQALGQTIVSPDPKEPTAFQQLAAFEFEVHYDNTKVCVDINVGASFAAANATCIIEDDQPSSAPQLEGVARIGCVTIGKGHGIDELVALASINVYPQPDLYSEIKPNQDNGNVVQINNVNCDVSDEQGHAIPIFSCDDADITFRYLEGDVEPDCVIDAADAQAIAFRWGVEKGSLIYSDFMNLEPSSQQADNDIDINDLQFVFGRFGSTCAHPHPPQDPVNPKS